MFFSFFPEGKGIDGGAIAGIVISVIIALVGGFAAGYFFVKFRQKRAEETEDIPM